jgi:hypothetical protein
MLLFFLTVNALKSFYILVLDTLQPIRRTKSTVFTNRLPDKTALTTSNNLLSLKAVNI